MPRFTLPAILLHWLIAILIVGAFALGVTMVDIPGITPKKLKYFSWHKWAGVTVLALACARLLWRLGHKAPAYPNSMQPWQQKAAHGLHGLLYVLMFSSRAAGVPVVYFGVIPLPVLIEPNPELTPLLKQVHYVLDMTLLACVVLHVLAALKHHFVDRDGVLKRMLP